MSDGETYDIGKLDDYATNSTEKNLEEWDKIREIRRICDSHKDEIWRCLTEKMKIFLMGKMMPDNIYILDLYLYLYPYKNTISVKVSFFRMPEDTALIETRESLKGIGDKFVSAIRELFPDTRREIVVELKPKYSEEG